MIIPQVRVHGEMRLTRDAPLPPPALPLTRQTVWRTAAETRQRPLPLSQAFRTLCTYTQAN